jgi:hypothetical protein
MMSDEPPNALMRWENASGVNSLRRIGALGEIRTPDPRIRSPMLYPAELRALSRRYLSRIAYENQPWRALAGLFFARCFQWLEGFCDNFDRWRNA